MTNDHDVNLSTKRLGEYLEVYRTPSTPFIYLLLSDTTITPDKVLTNRQKLETGSLSKLMTGLRGGGEAARKPDRLQYAIGLARVSDWRTTCRVNRSYVPWQGPMFYSRSALEVLVCPDPTYVGAYISLYKLPEHGECFNKQNGRFLVRNHVYYDTKDVGQISRGLIRL